MLEDYGLTDWQKRRQPAYVEARRRGGRKGGRALARQRRLALVGQDKTIFKLRTQRLTVKEIASVVGRSERSVYRSLARARRAGILA